MKKFKLALIIGLVASNFAACQPTGTSSQAKSDATSTSSANSQAATGANGSQASSQGNSSQTQDSQAGPKGTAIKSVDPNIILAEGNAIEVTSGDVQKEFELMVNSFISQYGEEEVMKEIATLEGQKPTILAQLVQKAVLAQKANDLKIPEQTEEAKAAYQQIVKQNIQQYGSPKKFQEAVQMAGFTMKSYEEEIYRNFRIKAVQEEVTKDIVVTDEEVKKYHQEHKKEFSKPAGAEIYHILFGKGEEGKKKAAAVKKEIDGGAKFEDKAKEHGTDGTKEKGGLLGYYPYDTQELVPEFMEAVKPLKNNQVSEPVESQFGWHLIMVKDVNPEPKLMALTETTTKEDGSVVTLADSIKDLIVQPRKTERMKELLAQWEKQYGVKRYEDKIPYAYPQVEKPENSSQGKESNAKP